jgi:chromosomal replication initiation ATPase DnaA
MGYISTTEFLYEPLLNESGEVVQVETNLPDLPEKLCFTKTPNYVIDRVIESLTGLNREELKVKDRDAKLAEVRQVGMYFYYKNGNSCTYSGMAYNRDHATVIHSVRKINNLYGQKTEQKLTEFVNKVSELTGIAV